MSNFKTRFFVGITRVRLRARGRRGEAGQTLAHRPRGRRGPPGYATALWPRGGNAARECGALDPDLCVGQGHDTWPFSFDVDLLESIFVRESTQELLEVVHAGQEVLLV